MNSSITQLSKLIHFDDVRIHVSLLVNRTILYFGQADEYHLDLLLGFLSFPLSKSLCVFFIFFMSFE
jgi:F0F1-type ATP synthase assembly protein I